MGTNNSYVPGLLLAASSSAAADTTPFANQVQLTSLPFRIDTEVRQEYLASESEIIEPAIFQDLLLAVPDEDEQAAAIGSDVADQYSRLLRDEVFEGLFEPESIDLDVR